MKDIQGLYDRAVSCFNRGNLLEAEMVSMELHSYKPFLAENLFLIAHIKHRLGKTQEAVGFAEACVVVRPQKPAYLAFLAKLNELKGELPAETGSN